MYIKNKPLINSILIGIIYLVLSWSIGVSNWLDGAFIVMMLYLPGVTFPLITTFPMRGRDYNFKRRILHIVLSILIFYGGVWLFSGHLYLKLKYISILAGLLGSVGYLMISRLLLKYPFSNIEILITGLLSGLAFLPFELFGGLSLVGMAISIWTVFNWYLLNLKYKTTAANIV